MPVNPTRILLVVEGANDTSFLLALADRLAVDNADCAAILQGITSGYILPLPVGGGDPSQWPTRFAALRLAEFHLYDREADAETDLRLAAIEALNQRPFCRGFVTARRSLENYLHPAAIATAGGGEMCFGKQDRVPELLARCWFERQPRNRSWSELPFRRQKRRIAKAKRWLNTRAVWCMTSELLSKTDPQGEVLGWFRCLAELAKP